MELPVVLNRLVLAFAGCPKVYASKRRLEAELLSMWADCIVYEVIYGFD